MTIGLTWRRTARRIKRLKDGVLTISPDYSDRPTPDFLALSRYDMQPPKHSGRALMPDDLASSWFSDSFSNQRLAGRVLDAACSAHLPSIAEISFTPRM